MHLLSNTPTPAEQYINTCRATQHLSSNAPRPVEQGNQHLRIPSSTTLIEQYNSTCRVIQQHPMQQGGNRGFQNKTRETETITTDFNIKQMISKHAGNKHQTKGFRNKTKISKQTKQEPETKTTDSKTKPGTQKPQYLQTRGKPPTMVSARKTCRDGASRVNA